MPLKIAGVLFPMWELLDLIGPLCVLVKAAEFSDDPDSSATFHLVGHSISEPNESASHLPTFPTHEFSTAPQFDVIIIPGGVGTRVAAFDSDVLDFFRRQEPNARFIASVCTGSCVLANTGLLDGRRATSNKSMFGFMSMFAREKVTYVREARYVEDGKMWTASGVSAGVDLGFAFAERLFGEKAARKVAAEWGYEPLSEGDDPFAKIYPAPDTNASEAEYKRTLESGPSIIDAERESVLGKAGKRRIATILGNGFELADIGFVGEAHLAVVGSHWFDLVQVDEAVSGGAGRFLDVARINADQKWSSKRSNFQLVDDLTDIVFVPSVNTLSENMVAALEDLANSPSTVRVIACGHLLVERLAAILGIKVEYGVSDWFKSGRWFFAKNVFGAMRASLEAMIELVGIEPVRAGVVAMELSPKLLPPGVAL
ncbi:class I glutamine amidotransferase-like protein [Cladochytrium replicatum]|nr:class I glutamine amidotransferase-like protein [Cladochytrium replicatum]